MTDWYALSSGDELFTADMLREANYPAYVPCETVNRKVKRVEVPIRRPLLPGYVFVFCSEAAFSAVRGIPGANSRPLVAEYAAASA